jgi:predicted DNA-binding transcriptional regulator AlpA
MKAMLRIDEVSEVTGIPVRTLRWYRAKGIGPHSFTLGGHRVVYMREDVEAWVQAQYDASAPKDAA